MGRLVLAVGWLLAIPMGLRAQVTTGDSIAIREARTAQNSAIASNDFETVGSFWIDEVQVTAGLGFIVSGKEAYLAALAADSALTYERTTRSLRLSEAWPLAFEQGTWRGWDDEQRTSISGHYAAQWVKRGSEWKIRSELFVATECGGDACRWVVGGPQP